MLKYFLMREISTFLIIKLRYLYIIKYFYIIHPYGLIILYFYALFINVLYKVLGNT